MASRNHRTSLRAHQSTSTASELFTIQHVRSVQPPVFSSAHPNWATGASYRNSARDQRCSPGVHRIVFALHIQPLYGRILPAASRLRWIRIVGIENVELPADCVCIVSQTNRDRIEHRGDCGGLEQWGCRGPVDAVNGFGIAEGMSIVKND